MKARVLASLLVAAAACGAHKGTSTGNTTGTGAGRTTGSAGGTVFATGSGANCGLLGTAAGQGGAAAACSGAPTGVSYSKDVKPILGGCMGDVCHHPIWTRENALNVPSTECCDGRLLIKPGDPEGSYIVDKIQGRVCTGRQMPADMLPLPSDQQKLIVGWICEGAPDN